MTVIKLVITRIKFTIPISYARRSKWEYQHDLRRKSGIDKIIYKIILQTIFFIEYIGMQNCMLFLFVSLFFASNIFYCALNALLLTLVATWNIRLQHIGLQQNMFFIYKIKRYIRFENYFQNLFFIVKTNILSGSLNVWSKAKKIAYSSTCSSVFFIF